MTYFDVIDVSFEEIESSSYDLVVFCNGYEERSIFFPGLTACDYKKALVLGFVDNEDNEYSRENEIFYAKHSRYKVKPVVINYLDANKIFVTLLDAVKDYDPKFGQDFRILVDYSSMPRLWYSEILNFLKCYDFGNQVHCDFVYSVGEHLSNGMRGQLSEPIVLPGCGAVSAYSRQTIGIFSLGFNEGGPVCLHGKIEPDKTFALIARPGALEDYTDKTIAHNEFFLNHCSDGIVFSPLSSVEQCYSVLREMVYPYLRVAGVVMVPFGPKPHALASIIAAMNYQEVSCLYSSMGGTGAAVKPTTELVICRVSKLKNSPYREF